MVEISHESDIEGSLGAVNRNRKRVELNGIPPLQGSGIGEKTPVL